MKDLERDDCEPIERLRREMPHLDIDTLREHIREGVHEAGKRLANDSDFARPFWQAAVMHGGGYLIDVFKRVIGGVLLLAVSVGVVGMVIRYAIHEGWLK